MPGIGGCLALPRRIIDDNSTIWSGHLVSARVERRDPRYRPSRGRRGAACATGRASLGGAGILESRLSSAHGRASQLLAPLLAAPRHISDATPPSAHRWNSGSNSAYISIASRTLSRVHKLQRRNSPQLLGGDSSLSLPHHRLGKNVPWPITD